MAMVGVFPVKEDRADRDSTATAGWTSTFDFGRGMSLQQLPAPWRKLPYTSCNTDAIPIPDVA